MAQEKYAHVISGTLSKVKVTNTTANVFFRAGDREGMAATGVAAAALGESGLAAGMTAMSTEEMSDQVCLVSFDLDGKHVEGMLWNWPFKDGDEVKVVVEPAYGGGYTGFAVLDPKEGIIVLYPHVSAGAKAHWRKVWKNSFLVALGISFLMSAFMTSAYIFSKEIKFEAIYIVGGGASLCMFVIFALVGYRIGNRFTPFIEMAEPIFTLLGWKDVKNIDLRKTTKAKKKPTDPPAMGDSYFRY
ncbi:hypothetical protein EYC55_12400 [Xanthomonas oryzae]|uniref:putative type VI secretion system effector n=1 Tax=Xanthomonas oryzae TaxID=347 RepID=UPI0010330CAD|nr:putative type VI secretion system effector [Xanthomonas oryzae]QBG96096.1 hypothetical protein EYC55_12400 [Xanthomonas oryzae]